MKRRFMMVLAVATALGSCGDDESGSSGAPFAPDAYCPGPDCPDEEGEGALEVGVGSADITPLVWNETLEDYEVVYSGERLEVHDDLDGDGYYDPGDGETYVDHNDNGRLDGVWIAGFGNARPASGVHDPQWARAVVLRHENTTMALVSIDSVGYFKGEMDKVRQSVADLGIDHVFIAATHVHQARDTIGLWGPEETTTGLDPAYMDYVVDQTDAAIRAAHGSLTQSTVQYASFRTRDLQDIPPPGSPQGMVRFHGDLRDPNIIDDGVRILRFRESTTGDTIATVVNFAAHPEYGGSHNSLLSSDFPHWLREGVEDGVMGPEDVMVEGVGGTTLYFSGALGGQIGPNDVDLIQWDGTPVEEDAPAMELDSSPGWVGTQLAYYVLQALNGELSVANVVEDETASIGFRTKEFYLHLQNRAYYVASEFGIFDRELSQYDPDLPITDDNEPAVLTEVTALDIGRAQLISTPGEMHPELFVGGYDESNTPEGQPIVDPANPNPPALEDAPGPPYLIDRAREDAEFVWLMGLGNDYLGYILPNYNFVLSETSPYFDQAPGDHYEETNSAGARTWDVIEENTLQLLEWAP
ncbi:MAG: neutral/alkaline non-lysosomal ceramidase N-terminal domain-containing protein [Myxococcota bacterium]